MQSSRRAEDVGVDCSNARHQVAAITSLFPNSVVREHIGAARRARRAGSGWGRNTDQEGTTTYFGGSATDPLLGFDWLQAASTCVELWAWYWVVYNTAVMPKVDGFYRIEDTSPNEVRALLPFSCERCPYLLYTVVAKVVTSQIIMYGKYQSLAPSAVACCFLTYPRMRQCVYTGVCAISLPGRNTSNSSSSQVANMFF